MTAWVHSLYLLWDPDGELPDGHQVDLGLNKVHEFARKLGKKPSKSTRTIPLELAPKLIQASIRWVLEIGPLVLDAEKLLAESAAKTRYAQEKARASVAKMLSDKAVENAWPFRVYAKTKCAQGITSLYIAIWNHLRAACFIVIAVFTGHRLRCELDSAFAKFR